MSILPVDQGIEHSAAASFAPNPAYFDPENIVELAIEGGCNAVASHLRRARASCRASYAHKIPFIVKLNHNELLTYPNEFDQIMFGTVEQAYDMGAAGVGATIYFGSAESHPPDPARSARPSQEAHELGMFTVLWCYLRNTGFKADGVDYHVAADLTGQANHLGVTIEADIIKQKLPDQQRRLQRPRSYGKTEQAGLRRARPPTTRSTSCRWQVANCYMGRIGLINSGGESKGASDLAEAVRTAVINKRAGGMGLISGRKAFQRPMAEGVELLNAIQDVYLDASSPSPDPAHRAESDHGPRRHVRPPCHRACACRHDSVRRLRRPA